jgi:hypothetical protein
VHLGQETTVSSNSVHEHVRTIEELEELVAFHEAQVARQDSLPSRARALSYLKDVQAELVIARALAEKYLPAGSIRPCVVKYLPPDPTYDWTNRKNRSGGRRR